MSKLKMVNIPPKDWAAAYGISLTPSPCKKCGELQQFTQPFTFKKEFAGLLSDHTKCGEEFRQSKFVNMSPKDRKSLGDFVTAFYKASKQGEKK